MASEARRNGGEAPRYSAATLRVAMAT